MQKRLIIKRILTIILPIIIMITLSTFFINTVSGAEVSLENNTIDDLQTAIHDAPDSTPTTIIIEDNFSFEGITVLVPADKDITIRSKSDTPYTLTQTSGRHFTVIGSLTLENINMDGSSSETSGTTLSGGVEVDSSGVLTLKDGAAIHNCKADDGGGIYGNVGSHIVMEGGTIRDNIATTFGGGIYVNSGVINPSTLTLTGGTISGNAANSGGGIYGNTNSTINVEDIAINRNSASNSGGGIYGNMGTSINVKNSTINDNISTISGGGIYGYMNTTIIIESSIISHNDTISGGGIYGYMDSIITVYDTTISSNTVLSSGGGIFGYSDSRINIYGGKISNNTSSTDGGGIYGFTRSTITVYDVKIIDNTSIISGGGIYGYIDSVITIGGGEISGNTTSINGGGIYGYTSSTINVYAGTISSNTAYNGGGIYVTSSSILNITGTNDICNITDNRAIDSGGGIYTLDESYANLIIADNTYFSGNTSSAAYTPPEDAESLYPYIRFASVSISTHPLNDFDINYIGPYLLTYNVTYDANGGTGSYVGPDIEPGGTDTVLSQEATGISREGYTFVGWNNQPNASGLTFAPGDEITLNTNVILYAMWTELSEPTKPTKPTKPTEPAKPIEPTKPTEPTKPAEPTKSTEQEQSGIVQTGDSNTIMLWISGSCISIVIFVCLLLITYRKKEGEDR